MLRSGSAKHKPFPFSKSETVSHLRSQIRRARRGTIYALCSFVRRHQFRWSHERNYRLRTSMITAALLAAFGAAALVTPASAAPLSPAPAATVAGAQDNVTNVRWHPIRRMHRAERRFMHRHFRHRR
jgi:hypothetical protein